MRRTLLFCAVALLAGEGVGAEATRRLLAVEPQSPWTLRELETLGADLVSYNPESGVAYVTADAHDEQLLFEHGFVVSTVELDVDAGFERLRDQDPGLGLYTTWDELVLALQELHATYPQLTRLEVLGHSLEGREIYALKISDAPAIDDPDKADVLIVGNHHARELMSVEVPLHFARTLLTGYQQQSRLRNLVNQREVWIVPMLNPDGHTYQAQTQLRPGWRKNRRREGDLVFGVDLNRNYPFKWGLDDVGSSGETFSNTYRGSAAFSEPETQALGRLVERHDFKIAISYHSFGELLLYPWGHTREHTTPDHDVYVALAAEMVRGNGYRPGNAYSGAIYLTNGVWDDYMYGEINAVKPTQTFAFTVELNSVGEGGFWPAEELIEPTCERLLSLNLYALEVAADVRVVTPPMAPLLTAVQDELDDHVIHLTWEQPGDVARIDHYEVFEIDPRGGPGAWQEAQGARLERDGRAVLARGVRLSDAGRLALRLKGVLEPLWDYAYVEVRAAGAGPWTTLAGAATRQSNPTSRNEGNGLTGTLHPAVYAFDAGAFAGQAVDVAVRLDAHGDTPRMPRLDAAIDIPEMLAEERRVIAPDVRGNRFDVVAERPGIFAYGVTAVDLEDQRTDSQIYWFVIPEFTAVELQDVVFELEGSGARLRWRTLSRSEAHFTAWSRPLRADEVPRSVAQEWGTGAYVRVADAVVSQPGAAALEWQLQGGREAVLLQAQDRDGRRFWGPWVTSGVAQTRLEAAWPNPFNPSTRLRYEVAQTSHVQLDIVGVDGRRVRLLVAGVVTAGAHTVHWDGRDAGGREVASGVYVARLRGGDVVRTRRLVLLR